MTVEEDIRRTLSQVVDERMAVREIALYYGELRWLVENGMLEQLTGGCRVLAHPGEVEELRAAGLLP